MYINWGKEEEGESLEVRLGGKEDLSRGLRLIIQQTIFIIYV